MKSTMSKSWVRRQINNRKLQNKKRQHWQLIISIEGDGEDQGRGSGTEWLREAGLAVKMNQMVLHLYFHICENNKIHYVK